MKTQQLTKTEIINVENDFSVNPDYAADRTGNYDLRDKIAAKWQNTDDEFSGCGNVHSMFYFDTKKQTFFFSKDYISHEKVSEFIPLYKVMSPALFLYRIIATFFGTPKCADSYKSIWGYDLIHKASGKGINFSEWKGAIGFWLPEPSHKVLTAEFKADIIELMNYLASNECAHPYDNLVAGSVA